jgi:hypothetical protein
VIKFARCITTFNLGIVQAHFKDELLKSERFDIFTFVSLHRHFTFLFMF